MYKVSLRALKSAFLTASEVRNARMSGSSTVFVLGFLGLFSGLNCQSCSVSIIASYQCHRRGRALFFWGGGVGVIRFGFKNDHTPSHTQKHTQTHTSVQCQADRARRRPQQAVVRVRQKFQGAAEERAVGEALGGLF